MTAMRSKFTPLKALLSIAVISLLFAGHLSYAEDRTEDPKRAPTDLELIKEGRRQYDRYCGACHALDSNRVGPKHRNVFGSKAGSVADFRYSRALSGLDVVWDDETLDLWLQDPPRYAPGTYMGFNLGDKEVRMQIIAYLEDASKRSEDGVEK